MALAKYTNLIPIKYAKSVSIKYAKLIIQSKPIILTRNDKYAGHLAISVGLKLSINGPPINLINYELIST